MYSQRAFFPLFFYDPGSDHSLDNGGMLGPATQVASIPLNKRSFGIVEGDAEPPVAFLSLHKYLWGRQDRWDDLIEEVDIVVPSITPSILSSDARGKYQGSGADSSILIEFLVSLPLLRAELTPCSFVK